MRLLIQWIITVFALVLAVWLVPGIYIQGTNAIIAFAVMAVILALINVFVKPLLQLLSIGFIILTLGLFLILINMFVLWLSSWICVNWLSIGFYVDGFWAAFWGALIVSAASWILSMILGRNK